jgi:hypothetical protein
MTSENKCCDSGLHFLVWANPKKKNGEDAQNRVSSISGTNCDVLTASNWACTSMQWMSAPDVWWFWFWQRKKGIQSERNGTGYGDRETRFLCLWYTLTHFKDCDADEAVHIIVCPGYAFSNLPFFLLHWNSVCRWSLSVLLWEPG